jgi:hypothetical protein
MLLVRVTFFTKPGCHLCEVIEGELLDLQERFGFTLIKKNILEDEALFEIYRIRIPVVEIAPDQDGAVPIQLEAPINQLELRRKIQSATVQG